MIDNRACWTGFLQYQPPAYMRAVVGSRLVSLVRSVSDSKHLAYTMLSLDSWMQCAGLSTVTSIAITSPVSFVTWVVLSIVVY